MASGRPANIRRFAVAGILVQQLREANKSNYSERFGRPAGFAATGSFRSIGSIGQRTQCPILNYLYGYFSCSTGVEL